MKVQNREFFFIFKKPLNVNGQFDIVSGEYIVSTTSMISNSDWQNLSLITSKSIWPSAGSPFKI